MHKLFFIVFIFILAALPAQLKIGQAWQGGKIFYIDKTGKHGLIAAPKDFSETATWDKAKQLCQSYRGGKYSNWYLPNKDELNLLYELKDLIGGFAPSYYWSSTEANANNAWYQVFFNGNQYGSYKNYAGKVRAIRAF